MPTSLIVLAHPEGRSFNGDWARASADGLSAAGHDVIWSDLYAQGFDPVEGPAHFPPRPDGFDVSEAHSDAVEHGHVPADVAAEIAKVEAADAVIFHFPVWWFGPPAMLKGWFDRVFVDGILHGSGRVFDTGPCRGKRALFCVTAGASAAQCAPSGKEGDLRLVLWPLAHALRYCGFSVLEPYIAPGVHRSHRPAGKILMEGQLKQLLADHPKRMAAIDRLPVWASNPDSDFDERGSLKPGAPVFSPFIRHEE
ncbi:flavodoxin family protein [Rhodobacterales bacterium HKCCE3408]|nr:flavodoxin family protein [Rhodobacterales bacterium HKCCE3408]